MSRTMETQKLKKLEIKEDKKRRRFHKNTAFASFGFRVQDLDLVVEGQEGPRERDFLGKCVSRASSFDHPQCQQP